MSGDDFQSIIQRLDKMERCMNRLNIAFVGDEVVGIEGVTTRLRNVETSVQILIDASEKKEATNNGIKIGLGLTSGGTLLTAIFTGLSYWGLL